MPTSSARKGLRAVVSVSRAIGAAGSVAASSRATRASSAAGVVISSGWSRGGWSDSVLLPPPAGVAVLDDSVAAVTAAPLSGLVASLGSGGVAENSWANLATCLAREKSSSCSRLPASAVLFTWPSGSRGSWGRGISTRISASMRER